MGLDIAAYKGIKFLYPIDLDLFDGWDRPKGEVAIAPVHFRERMGSLKDGVYSYAEVNTDRIGSYGYYNVFRNALSELALEAPADTVWANRKEYEDQPFFELINFSDAEGILGPEVCMELHADFESWDSDADSRWWDELDSHLYNDFIETYRQLASAVCFAAGDGFVSFR